jgi:hypothetical protein
MSLIQRLNGPLKKDGSLESIFSFAGMRGAEFDCDDAVETLLGIHNQKNNMVCTTFSVPVEHDVFDRDHEGEAARETTFYIIQSNKAQAKETAQKFIRDQAGPENIRHKEPTYFKMAVFADPGTRTRPIAWIDLDIGFLVFLRYETFRETARHLGIEHKIPDPNAGAKEDLPGRDDVKGGRKKSGVKEQLNI